RRRADMRVAGAYASPAHEADRAWRSASQRPASSRLLVLLVVVNLGELRVDDVVLLAGGVRASTGLLLVHRFAELHGSLRQRVGLGGDRLGIGALEGFLEVGHRGLDGTPLGLTDF